MASDLDATCLNEVLTKLVQHFGLERVLTATLMVNPLGEDSVTAIKAALRAVALASPTDTENSHHDTPRRAAGLHWDANIDRVTNEQGYGTIEGGSADDDHIGEGTVRTSRKLFEGTAGKGKGNPDTGAGIGRAEEHHGTGLGDMPSTRKGIARSMRTMTIGSDSSDLGHVNLSESAKRRRGDRVTGDTPTKRQRHK